MSTLTSRPYIRLTLFTTLLGLAAAIVFGSWGVAPYTKTLQQLAGDAAFKQISTDHTLQLNGKAFAYQSTSGYIPVSDADQHSAHVFYTAYTHAGLNRPLTFVFNGGPGSSSIWLHMGSFGPVRAQTGKAGFRDNKDTWLAFTDVVFIDPVATGYSRAADGTDARRFYGYQEDIAAIGSFIRQYLAQNQRVASAVFLAGESYGAARAVGLAKYLGDELKIPVAGLTLISPALDYKLISFRDGNETPYPYYLSAYAAAAKYHNRLPAYLQVLSAGQLQQRVNQFAFGAYQRALVNHQPISTSIIDTLSAYTGLDTATVRRLDGRIKDSQFASLLLNADKEKLGIYDSRDTAKTENIDPSEAKLRAVFPQAFQQLQKDVLHYDNNLPYLVTIATPDWKYGQAATNGYLNVVPVLKDLLKRTDIKVQIVTGDYDLATPSATINQTVADLGGLNNKLTVGHYPAGHMIYTDNRANRQWHKAAGKFYGQIIPKLNI